MPLIQSSPKTVSAALALEIVTALCDYTGYEADVVNPTKPEETIPNPISKAQHSQKILDDRMVEFVRNVVIGYRTKQVAVDTNIGI